MAWATLYLDRVTPAIWGIVTNLPERHVDSWNTNIEPVLQQERFIYKVIFQSYAVKEKLSRSNEYVKPMMQRWFSEMNLRFDEEVIDAVLNYYLSMCDEDYYWPLDQFASLDQLLSFDEVLSLWREKNERKMERCKSKMIQWDESRRSKEG